MPRTEKTAVLFGTIFLMRNRYDKFSEEHYQRAYTVEEIKEALNLAGLEFVTVYDAFTRNEPNSESERIYVVARECQKNQVSK